MSELQDIHNLIDQQEDQTDDKLEKAVVATAKIRNNIEEISNIYRHYLNQIRFK